MNLTVRFSGFLEVNDQVQSAKSVFCNREGYPAHKTKKVQAWLNENTKRIEVFFIPSTVPELNAQEYLTQDDKTNVIEKKRPINKEQIKKFYEYEKEK